MSTPKQVNVPRFTEIVGRKPIEDKYVESTYQKARALYRADTARYGFGTAEGKAAWRRRIQATRSF